MSSLIRCKISIINHSHSFILLAPIDSTVDQLKPLITNHFKQLYNKSLLITNHLMDNDGYDLYNHYTLLNLLGKDDVFRITINGSVDDLIHHSTRINNRLNKRLLNHSRGIKRKRLDEL